MNSQKKVMEILEAAAIVQGLNLLIAELNRQNENTKDNPVVIVTFQFLQDIIVKYSHIASTPLTGDQKNLLSPQVFTTQQLQRSFAETYMNFATN